MPKPYPIVDQRPLVPASKKGPLGRKRRTREPGEIPVAYAHQVLVYRVNGEYILDRASRDLKHDEVVAATHVSVVDLSHDHPAIAELAIPSADGQAFKVRVTFLCTVDDPVQVVRTGAYDVAEVLVGYLREHERIFELGLGYELEQINDFRIDVRAQVLAYTTVHPPMISGMSVRMASTEVLTPEVVEVFEETRRGQRFDDVITSEGQQFQYERDYAELRRQHVLDKVRLTHDQGTEYDRQQHKHALDSDNRRHERLETFEQREFEQREMARLMEMIGGDEGKALIYALVNGGIAPTGLVDALQGRADRAQEIEERREDHDRADRRKREEWEHEERIAEIAADREQELRKALWEREDLLRVENQTREDRKRLAEVNLKVLEELAKAGHLDLVNVDLNRIVEHATGVRQPEVEADAVASIEESAGGSEEEPDVDVDVKDEDDD